MRLLGPANESSNDVLGLVEIPTLFTQQLILRPESDVEVSHPEGRPGAAHRFLPDPHLREGRREPARPPTRRQNRHARTRQDPDRRGLLSTLRAPGNAGSLASPPPRSRLWAGTFLLAAGLAALPS